MISAFSTSSLAILSQYQRLVCRHPELWNMDGISFRSSHFLLLPSPSHPCSPCRYGLQAWVTTELLLEEFPLWSPMREEWRKIREFFTRKNFHQFALGLRTALVLKAICSLWPPRQLEPAVTRIIQACSSICLWQPVERSVFDLCAFASAKLGLPVLPHHLTTSSLLRSS